MIFVKECSAFGSAEHGVAPVKETCLVALAVEGVTRVAVAGSEGQGGQVERGRGRAAEGFACRVWLAVEVDQYQDGRDEDQHPVPDKVVRFFSSSAPKHLEREG